MYDRNGLQLSTAKAETLNTYRLTSVDLTTKKYTAYARASRPGGNNQWSMFKIGNQFKDPRDAAYVAQEFEKQYTHEQVRQMYTDGTFYDIGREFVQNLEIPEWNYPAEGLLVEDILNDYGYKQNYVPDAKTALREAISVFGIKPPSIKDIPGLVKKVETLYNEGATYREAAMKVLNIKMKEPELS
jgi:hypothetical protein